jgi:predicted permease
MSLSLGDVIYTAVKPIFKIYFIIGCGFILGRYNMLTVETSRNLSDIIISLIFPCLVFTKIVTNLQNSDIKQIGIICLIYVLFTVIGGLGGLGCYLLGKPKYWMGGALSVALMPNISDLPIAYIQTFSSGEVLTEAEGEKGVAYICIFTAVQILFQFNLGLFKLIGYDIDQQRKHEIEESHEESRELQEVKGLERILSHRTEMSYSSSRDHDNEELLVVPLASPSGLERVQSKLSNASLRRSKSQTVVDLINEYSQADAINQDVHAVPAQLTDLKLVPTHQENKPCKKSKLKALLLFTLDNWRRPISISLVVSMTVSMIPWVKALFVHTNQAYIPNAPDGLPPLSFIVDFTGYIANACVPLGLLILGATLSRLHVSRLSWSFIRTPLMLSILRLVIMPVLGTAIIAGFAKCGWFMDDDVLRFCSTIVWGLPNATSLIYLTAFYTPLEGEWLQMDQLALTYIIQYPLLSVSLPFLTTYMIKVSLGY